MENVDDKKYIDLINSGQILRAVKEYREDNKCSLQEAKDYIDKLGGNCPRQEKRGGCLGVIALLVLLSSTAICFFL